MTRPGLETWEIRIASSRNPAPAGARLGLEAAGFGLATENATSRRCGAARDARELTIRVHVAGHLKDYTGQSVDLELQGAKDIVDVIAQLDARVPNVGDRVLDEHGRTRRYINIYVNEEDIRGLDGEATKTQDGDVIYILPSIAGGKVELSAEEDETE